MFERILVPADLTDRNVPAVEMAAKLLSPSRGTIHLLHVIEIIPGFTIEEERDFYTRLEAAAARHLAALAKPLQARNVPVEAEVAYGPRAKTILDRAARIAADVIVVQSHRVDVEGRERHEGFGTLSYQIGILAPCPVLLLK
jgi:nucleotide-binding universal stress UspA family protein